MFVNCSERSWSSPQCWESLRKGWEWLQNVRVCSECVCLEMAVLGAPDRLQGGIYLKFMWISWKQLSIPFQIYRATPFPPLSRECWAAWSDLGVLFQAPEGSCHKSDDPYFLSIPWQGQESFPAVLGMGVLALTGMVQTKLQRQGFLHCFCRGGTFSFPDSSICWDSYLTCVL